MWGQIVGLTDLLSFQSSGLPGLNFCYSSRKHEDDPRERPQIVAQSTELSQRNGKAGQ